MRQENQDIKEILKWEPISRLFWENIVYYYENYYYKIPSNLAKKTMYKNVDAYKRVYNSFQIVKRHFWNISIIPQTEMFQNEERFYIIKQSQIVWEKLSQKHLRNNPHLASKFKKIIEANEKMWIEQWFFLDLLGSEYFIQPKTLHNLMTDWENIYIFDFGLFEKSPANNFFRFASHSAKKFQSFFIKRLFYD